MDRHELLFVVARICCVVARMATRYDKPGLAPFIAKPSLPLVF
jgi:hypothetical protein